MKIRRILITLVACLAAGFGELALIYWIFVPAIWNLRPIYGRKEQGMGQKRLKQILAPTITFLVGIGFTFGITMAIWNLVDNQQAIFPKFAAETIAIATGFWLAAGTLLATGVSAELKQTDSKSYLELVTAGVTNGVGCIIFPIYRPTENVTSWSKTLDWKFPKATLFTGIFWFSCLKFWLDSPWSSIYTKIITDTTQLIIVVTFAIATYLLGQVLNFFWHDMPISVMLIIAVLLGAASPVLGILVVGGFVLNAFS